MELGAAPIEEEALGPRLEQLWEASLARKWVQLAYYSPKSKVTERKVDPYGLALRGGIWSLVGFCHLRQGVRTFHVHRIRNLRMNPAKPKTPDFEVPKDFRLDDYVAANPWQLRLHEPMEVTVSLRDELAPLAARLFPGGALTEEPEGQVTVRLQVGFLEGLLRHALSLGKSCRVLSPPEAVGRYRELALRVLEKHREHPEVRPGDAA
jgi:proteasome accessory factor B